MQFWVQWLTSTVLYCTSVMALHIPVPSHHYKTRSRRVSSHRPREHIQISDRCINIFLLRGCETLLTSFAAGGDVYGQSLSFGQCGEHCLNGKSGWLGSLGVTNLKVTPPLLPSLAPRCSVTAVNTGDCWSPPDTRHTVTRGAVRPDVWLGCFLPCIFFRAKKCEFTLSTELNIWIICLDYGWDFFYTTTVKFIDLYYGLVFC